jgi:phosphoribosylglycinamide formyltransferase-1
MANLPIAVLISGGGTTLRNLLALAQSGDLPVDFRMVISSSDAAAGLNFARAANIATQVIARRLTPSPEVHRQLIFDQLRALGVQLVVMGV